MTEAPTRSPQVPPLRCVHCLEPLEDRTADHLLPHSWYPTSTPSSVQRATFPSCKACNVSHGAIEDRLRSSLVLALDPSAEAAKGLVQSVRRSMDPERGRNDNDRRLREARRNQVFQQVLRADEVEECSILPGLGPRPGTPVKDQVALTVEPKDVHALVEKLVRGITYIDTGLYIGPSHEILAVTLDARELDELKTAMRSHGATTTLGPGLLYEVARSPEDPLAAWYVFRIWQSLTLPALSRSRTKRPACEAEQ